MVKTKVVSSFIGCLSSNKRKKTFTVYMANGSRYRYAGVTQDVAIEAQTDESPGGAYNELIKGQFLCLKLV